MPKSALNPDQIVGMDAIMAEAVTTKFMAAPLTKDKIAVAIVGAEAMRGDRLRAERQQRGVELALIASADGDHAPLFAETPCDRQPDAAGPTGDQCDFARQLKIHFGSIRFLSKRSDAQAIT